MLLVQLLYHRLRRSLEHPGPRFRHLYNARIGFSPLAHLLENMTDKVRLMWCLDE